MFCFKCGAPMADTAQACPQCGALVAGGPQSPPPPVSLPGGAAAVPQPYAASPETDGKAVGSLILGILAIFPFGIVAGIPAVILGHMAKSSIAKSMGRLKGQGMALAGLIMGYFSLAFVPLILIIAAIALPNLMRARAAANESSAAYTVRTVNRAQVAYSTEYPAKGFAPDLSTLGPGPSGVCNGEGNEAHACLLDSVTGAARCHVGVWCFSRRHDYMYLMNATCSEGTCSDYVTLATPITPGTTGNRSFCSTSDAIIRVGTLSRTPVSVSVEECKLWPPLT